MTDPAFSKLVLPLGAYQEIAVVPVTGELEQWLPPVYDCRVSSAMSEPFKVETTRLIMDRRALDRLAVLATLLAKPEQAAGHYRSAFRKVDFFKIMEDYD